MSIPSAGAGGHGCVGAHFRGNVLLSWTCAIPTQDSPSPQLVVALIHLHYLIKPFWFQVLRVSLLRLSLLLGTWLVTLGLGSANITCAHSSEVCPFHSISAGRPSPTVHYSSGRLAHCCQDVRHTPATHHSGSLPAGGRGSHVLGSFKPPPFLHAMPFSSSSCPWPGRGDFSSTCQSSTSFPSRQEHGWAWSGTFPRQLFVYSQTIVFAFCPGCIECCLLGLSPAVCGGRGLLGSLIHMAQVILLGQIQHHRLTFEGNCLLLLHVSIQLLPLPPFFLPLLH